MMELDYVVGELLNKLDDLGIADNTIVIFTSDNGTQISSWPDGGNHPFKGEKGTTWEGGFRVPFVARWPGTIKPDIIINDIMANEDWMPTLLAAAGDPDVKQELLQGKKVGDKKFNVHLDGYNFQPFFKGEVDKGPRREFFYFTDNGDLHALRYDDYKISFKTIDGNLFTGTVVEANVPLVVNLRQDPFERFPDEAPVHGTWWAEKLWVMMPAVVITGQFLGTFKEYPPSQKVGTTGVSDFLQAIQAGAMGSNN